jgi:hypothetical protein
MIANAIKVQWLIEKTIRIQWHARGVASAQFHWRMSRWAPVKINPLHRLVTGSNRLSTALCVHYVYMRPAPKIKMRCGLLVDVGEWHG